MHKNRRMEPEISAWRKKQETLKKTYWDIIREIKQERELIYDIRLDYVRLMKLGNLDAASEKKKLEKISLSKIPNLENKMRLADENLVKHTKLKPSIFKESYFLSRKNE